MDQRIAVYVPSLGGGGAERTMLNVANGLANKGYSVDLLTATSGGEFVDKVSPKVNLIDFRARRTISSLPQLVQYLRVSRPHVLMSALNRANILAVVARRMAMVSTRLIVTERNMLSQVTRYSDNANKRVTKWLSAVSYRDADAVIAVSRSVAQDLEHTLGLPSGTVLVIYNPVVTKELQERVNAPVKHEWFIPDRSVPVFISVGRLNVQKNHKLLIDAFAQLRYEYAARLVILGEGPERRNLERQIASYGIGNDCMLPGWVDNPYPYIKSADAFILSSSWEGLPGVLIEAMYCEVPIIATDCPGGTREILNDGEHGCLVPVDHAEGMRLGMEQVLRDKVNRPSRNSWAAYEEHNVLSAYEKLLTGNR